MVDRDVDNESKKSWDRNHQRIDLGDRDLESSCNGRLDHDGGRPRNSKILSPPTHRDRASTSSTDVPRRPAFASPGLDTLAGARYSTSDGRVSTGSTGVPRRPAFAHRVSIRSLALATRPAVWSGSRRARPTYLVALPSLTGSRHARLARSLLDQRWDGSRRARPAWVAALPSLTGSRYARWRSLLDQRWDGLDTLAGARYSTSETAGLDGLDRRASPPCLASPHRLDVLVEGGRGVLRLVEGHGAGAGDDELDGAPPRLLGDVALELRAALPTARPWWRPGRHTSGTRRSAGRCHRTVLRTPRARGGRRARSARSGRSASRLRCRRRGAGGCRGRRPGLPPGPRRTRGCAGR